MIYLSFSVVDMTYHVFKVQCSDIPSLHHESLQTPKLGPELIRCIAEISPQVVIFTVLPFAERPQERGRGLGQKIPCDG